MTHKQVAQRFVNESGYHLHNSPDLEERLQLMKFLAKEVLRAEVCWPSMCENNSFALAVDVAHTLGVPTP